MTPEELTQRIAAGEDHLELSIEKHIRARLKKNWGELCDTGSEYFCSDTCGLCLKWQKRDGFYYTCSGCPLLLRGHSMGCGSTSDFQYAYRAIKDADRPAFMRHSRALILEMEAAR